MAFSYKSAISFGLVYIPVTLHATVKSKDIGFNMLYKKTGERIQYKKTCGNCPEHVLQSDIIKGYQYEKDKYITLTEEEFEKIKSEKNKSIDISRFVDLNEIDPIYYDKSYYVNPTGADKAFELIKKAIETEGKVGIAKTVLGTKEQLLALRVVNGTMIINTMHFYDEVVKNPSKESKEKITADELKLAKQVISNMTKIFTPEEYKDEYRERLEKAIEQKIAGKKIKGDDKPHSNVKITNLMEALKASVKMSVHQ